MDAQRSIRQVFPDVLVAPFLMLVTWKHSLGACSTMQIDPVAYLDTFLSMALNGMLPRAAGGVVAGTLPLPAAAA